MLPTHFDQNLIKKNRKLGVGSKVFPQRSGAIVKVATAIQLFCIIPHPTIYLLPKFKANWLKNDRVIEWVPFLGFFTVFGGAAGGAAGGPLLVVGSAQNFSHKILIPQGCLTKNFSPIG